LRILAVLNSIQGHGFVYCDDDYLHHDKLCVNLFTTRAFVKATGAPFMCPDYPADWIDTAWMCVGKETGTAYYLDSVVIRHEHATRGQNMDDTYRRLRGAYENITESEEEKIKFCEYVSRIIDNLGGKK